MVILKQFTVTILSILVFGCSFPKYKQDLKNAEIQEVGLEFAINYQVLLKCWSDNAIRQGINSMNATYVEIYEEIGEAEIFVPLGDGKYIILIEINKIAPDKTLINAYGTGYMGSVKVPEWLSVMRDCESQNPQVSESK